MVKPENLVKCQEYLERFKALSDAESFKTGDKEYFKTLTFVSEQIPLLMTGTDEAPTKKSPYHGIIKGYVTEMLGFLGEESLASPDAKCVLMRGLPVWLPLLSGFPESRKKLTERLIEIWAGVNSDDSRLAALLAIHKALSLYPKLIEGVLKKMYRAFGKACKSLSVHTLGTATFLLNGLVEIFSIDTAKSAVLAKKAVRQLAALLQSSIKSPTKESMGKVYCWGFVWAVKFLARLVAHTSNTAAGSFGEVSSQVLGLIHAGLGYNFVPRFYAHHFHLIGAAAEICRATQAYFPATPFLLQVLRRIVSTSTKPESGKPKVFDFTTICKVPKNESTSRSYLDCAAEEALYLIGESLSGFAQSPSFPELAQPIATQLRSIESINKTWKVSKLCATLASKLDQHSKLLITERANLPDAAPSKTPATTVLAIPTEKDVLEMYRKHTQRVREQRRKMVASNTENKTYQEPELDDSDVEEAVKSKKANKSKKRSGSDDETDVDEDGEEEKPKSKKRALGEKEEAGLLEGVRQILESSKKPKTKSKKTKSSDPQDDVLEDFDLSDF